MLLTRGTFYWLWFTLFGVILVLATFVQSAPLSREIIWLSLTGGLGVLIDAPALASRWARPYDALVGVVFSVAGWLGILHSFGINLINTSAVVSGGFVNDATFLGLDLALSAALLHTTLGFFAFKFALRNVPMVSSLEVNTTEKDK